MSETTQPAQLKRKLGARHLNMIAIGGSIGTALLNTIATTSAAAYVAARPHRPGAVPDGVVHGYTVAIAWAGVIMIIAALTAGLMVTAPAPKHGAPAGSAVREQVG